MRMMPLRARSSCARGVLVDSFEDPKGGDNDMARFRMDDLKSIEQVPGIRRVARLPAGAALHPAARAPEASLGRQQPDHRNDPEALPQGRSVRGERRRCGPPAGAHHHRLPARDRGDEHLQRHHVWPASGPGPASDGDPHLAAALRVPGELQFVREMETSFNFSRVPVYCLL